MTDRIAPAVTAEQLRRVFRASGQPERVALDGLDLAIEPGEVHGLLGPNGAGKTTLCKILATVLLPTSGSAQILGHDVQAHPAVVRRLIGIAFGGERGLYGRLTARQNLRYWSALYRQPSAAGRRRAADLLSRVGLAERADERVETFSRGMKQRLHLARALIGDPQVLLLDEPTAGMDPVAARDFRKLIDELRSDRRAILVTTHDMAEAESICDMVSLIDCGRLLTTQDPRTIGHWLTAYERITAEGVPDAVVAQIEGLDGVTSVTAQGGSLAAQADGEQALGRVIHVLVSAGVTTISTRPPSLEEVYLQVIGDRGLTVS
jgi:ABC-2 type transport system ATP-binding protein